MKTETCRKTECMQWRLERNIAEVKEISKQLDRSYGFWGKWGRKASPVLLWAGTWYSLWSRFWTWCSWSQAVAGWWCGAAWVWLRVTWVGCGPRLSSSPGKSSWGSVGFQWSLRTTSSWVGFLGWRLWSQGCGGWSGHCDPNGSALILLLVGRKKKDEGCSGRCGKSTILVISVCQRGNLKAREQHCTSV